MATSLGQLCKEVDGYLAKVPKLVEFLRKKEGLSVCTEVIGLLQQFQDAFIAENFYRQKFDVVFNSLTMYPLGSLLTSLRTSGYQLDISPKNIEDYLLNPELGILRRHDGKLQLSQISLIYVNSEHGQKQVVSGRHRIVSFALLIYGVASTAFAEGKISESERNSIFKLCFAQKVPVLLYSDVMEAIAANGAKVQIATRRLNAMIPVMANQARTVSKAELSTALQAASGVIPGNPDTYERRFAERDFKSFGPKDLFSNFFLDFASGMEYTGTGAPDDNTGEWVPLRLGIKRANKPRLLFTRTTSAVAATQLASTVYNTLCGLDDTARSYSVNKKGVEQIKFDQLFKPGLVGYDVPYQGNAPKYSVSASMTQPLLIEPMTYLLNCMFNYEVDWSLSTEDASVLMLLADKSWIEGVLAYAVYLKADDEFNLSRSLSSVRTAIESLHPSLHSLIEPSEFYPSGWFGTKLATEDEEEEIEEDMSFDESDFDDLEFDEI